MKLTAEIIGEWKKVYAKNLNHEVPQLRIAADEQLQLCDLALKGLGIIPEAASALPEAGARVPTHWYCVDCDEYVSSLCNLCAGKSPMDKEHT